MICSQIENPSLASSPVRGATFWRVREYAVDPKARPYESRLIGAVCSMSAMPPIATKFCSAAK